MKLFQSRPKMRYRASRLPIRQRKRFSGKMFVGASLTLLALVLVGVTFALQQLNASHAASPYDYNHVTTINGLKKIAQVGSTATILDARGKQITVDPNPYKVAVAPADTSYGLKAGDIVVSNIGNEDKGVTLVKFTGQQGPGRLFNQMNDGVLGPSGLAFDNGNLLVANSTGNSVLVFNTNGKLLLTITNPLFNGPWGIAVGFQRYGDGGRNAMFSFFTANKFDAKILRVDITTHKGDIVQFSVTQIGQFTKNGKVTKIDLHWLPLLKIGNHIWKDVLLAVDPANNRIAAFANSSAIRSQWQGLTVFKGKPLNMPGGIAINPFNGDLLVVNLMDNNLVELNLTLGKVVGVKQIDPVKVDNQGNGSALFGVVAVKDQRGNLRVYFTDDNTNTLDVLKVS